MHYRPQTCHYVLSFPVQINGRYAMSLNCMKIVEAEEVEFQKIEELLKKLTIVEAILNINHVLERTNPLDVSLRHAQ